MREDMAKVIIERPRVRHTPAGRNYRRREQRLARLDLLPVKESMTAGYPGHNQSDFNDLLGPLKRYLITQAKRGRAWNDVYSELSERCSRNGKIQPHMRRHAVDMVALDVQMVDGEPRPPAHSRLTQFSRYTVVWVHPDTGILMPMPARKKRTPRERIPKVFIDAYNLFAYIDGVWKRVVLRPLPSLIFDMDWRKPVRCKVAKVTDAVLGELDMGYYSYGRSRAEIFWGSSVYAVAANGVGRKEEKVLARLMNAPNERRVERNDCVRPGGQRS